MHRSVVQVQLLAAALQCCMCGFKLYKQVGAHSWLVLLAVASTEAVLMTLDSPDQLIENVATVILSAKDLNAFLLRTRKNATLQQLVQGVLVNPSGMQRVLLLDARAQHPTQCQRIMMIDCSICTTP